ncbi:MAG: Cyclic di-GMP phosphodiesterase response regulator RpfG [Elusimicrobia bacterium ADurb.Bin231]|nr:MAG: Cyclic di-GMP phosphodiesterase response regulator RpfG [Elusimicrobia bacterium ADurb.Bin231]
MSVEMNNSRLNEFFEIARTITSTLDIDALLRKIGSAAEKLTGTAASSIMLVDDDKKNLYFKTAGGEKGVFITRLKIPIGDGVAGWVAQHREPLVVQDVKSDARFTGRIDKTSGFETKSILCVPMILNNELIGVVEVLNKKDGSQFTEEDKIILGGLANFVATAIVNARNTALQQNFFTNIFEILTHAFESKSPMFSGHSFKVAQIATALARELNIRGDDYRTIYYAAVLHDVGFINIPEYSVIDHGTDREHPAHGCEIVKNITLLKNTGNIIKCHHELYDGSGFPEGLKGNELPISARILSLAELVEDLRFRSYGEDKIREFVKTQTGIKFDLEVGAAYTKVFG